MKMDKKMIAALIAASLSLTAAQADDQSKSQNEPAGAEASSQSQSDAASSSSSAETSIQGQSSSADAQLEIQQEPAGAESQTSQESSVSAQSDVDVEVDEAAGAESEDAEEAKSPEKFVKKASQSGLMEVKAGQLAAQKAQSSSVKQFGDRLAKDHQKANDQLKTIAQKKGMAVSDQLEQKHQKHLDHLSSLSGEQFDREFIKQAAMHHKKDIKLFEKQAQEGEDPAIRSFASETLPVLREHLKIAERLQENRNASIPELSEPAGAESPSQSGDQSLQQDSSSQEQESSSPSLQDPAGAQPEAQSSESQSSSDDQSSSSSQSGTSTP